MGSSVLLPLTAPTAGDQYPLTPDFLARVRPERPDSMTLENAFLLASMLMGTAQVVDAFFLSKARGAITRPAFYFSCFEYVWAALCLFVAMSLQFGMARWLAALFVVYVPGSIAIAFLSTSYASTKDGRPTHVPMTTVYFGGAFGLTYALASIFMLNR
jgi:hypothetical protein